MTQLQVFTLIESTVREVGFSGFACVCHLRDVRFVGRFCKLGVGSKRARLFTKLRKHNAVTVALVKSLADKLLYGHAGTNPDSLAEGWLSGFGFVLVSGTRFPLTFKPVP